MKNDKQDRKLLAQLAAGYMASCGHPELAKSKDKYEIKDSVEYAIGALAAIDAHLEARRVAEVETVPDVQSDDDDVRRENEFPDFISNF